MKNFNLFNHSSGQGEGQKSPICLLLNPYFTLTRLLPDSVSILSRQSLLPILLLCLTLFVGVGQMWGDTWTRVTKASDVLAGGTFIIGYEATANSGTIVPLRTNGANATTSANGYLYSGTGSGTTSNSSTISMSNPGTTTNYELTITAYSNNQVELKMADGKYINFTGTSSNNLKLATSSSASTRFTVTVGTNDVVTLANASSSYTARGLRYNSQSPRYSNYSKTDQKGFVMYKKGSSCSNSVTISTGTPTNATITASATSITTCSSTATDRQVTVSVAPASCYAAPVAASVSKSGTAASKATRKSGPTWNSTTQKYDYVFEFDQNTSGAISFNISLSTKTTYTVNFNKGNATGATGEASSDTKTCGEALTLPNSALFTRTGYTQQGWSTAQAGTTKTYNLGGSYTTDAATTLFPYWQANSYSVTWKVNNTNYSAGGSTSVNHDSHIASLPTAPNPASYCGDKFVGWTTDAEYVHGSSPLYTTASQFPNATTDQIFYAVFADYDE